MVNKTIMQGRFVRKPELEQKGGFPYCEFTIAWSEKRKDRETKCFLNCKSWRGLAEHVEKFFDKGQECIITGQLVTEEWESEGQKRSRQICNVETIDFCGSKGSGTVTAGNEGFMNVPDTEKEELPFT